MALTQQQKDKALVAITKYVAVFPTWPQNLIDWMDGNLNNTQLLNFYNAMQTATNTQIETNKAEVDSQATIDKQVLEANKISNL